MPMKLMGVDVGYSITRSTTGIACLEGDELPLVSCVHRNRMGEPRDKDSQRLQPILNRS
jgi:hypothetical protein